VGWPWWKREEEMRKKDRKEREKGLQIDEGKN